MMHRSVLALLLALLTAEARAVMPEERLADPALEARARILSRELRCQVCQNQSIDDSNAPLAADLRRLVRERLVAGDSDAQVLAFVVARYGDFIRLTPPMRADTMLLWSAPLLVLLAGGTGLFLWFRRRHAREAPPLDEQEARELQQLLDDKKR
jgi:cytochrome c-type biogenesis protein CcmH